MAQDNEHVDECNTHVLNDQSDQVVNIDDFVNTNEKDMINGKLCMGQEIDEPADNSYGDHGNDASDNFDDQENEE